MRLAHATRSYAQAFAFCQSAINQAFDLDILDLLFVSSKAQVPYVRLRTRDNKTSMNYMRVLQLSYRRPFLETLKQINEKDIIKRHLSSFLRFVLATV